MVNDVDVDADEIVTNLCGKSARPVDGVDVDVALFQIWHSSTP